MDARRLFTGAPRTSAAALLAVNLLPLAGVLFLGWDLGLVMVLFWLENVVVGIYAIARMAVLARWAAVLLVPFFVFHYGMFTAVHGLFVLLLFVGGPTGSPDESLPALVDDGPAILLVGAALLVSHGVSFWTNFLKGPERERMAPNDPMGRAYVRVIVLHVTIIAGAFPTLALGEPRWALAILVVLKLLADLAGHAHERRSIAARAVVRT